jgi:hypothetical protein
MVILSCLVLLSSPKSFDFVALHGARRSVFVKNEKERPRICFLCVGKALSLAR